MKRFFLAGVTVLALMVAQPTLAADAPVYKGPVPVAAALFNWSGLYIGINGGYGWGNSRWTAPGGVPDTGDFRIAGGLIGGTLGYNWQTGPLVLGIEGDLDWSGIGGSTLIACGATGCTTTNHWLATLRGRVGYAWDRSLLYATGGLAVGDVKAEIVPFPSSTSTQTGWTIGGGLEVALAPNWSVKAEYLYVRLSDMSCPAASCVPGATVPFIANIVRVGANMRF